MIIGVSGFGFSGSGAVIDILSDYEELFVAKQGELSIIYRPDGIDDLKYAIVDNPIRYYSSDSAIRRFIHNTKRLDIEFNSKTGGKFGGLSEEYIKHIIQVQWKGSTMAHFCQEEGVSYFLRQRLARGLRRRFEKIFGPIRFPFPPDKTMYYSQMKEEEFIHITKKYLDQLILSMVSEDAKDKHIVLDQLFSPDNPERDFIYFQDPRAIVVKRDPRDVYILAKRIVGMDGRFLPSDNVDDFIRYYRGLLEGCRIYQSEKTLILSFEDLVYAPADSRRKIEDFLGLHSISVKDSINFDYKKSINNTQLYLRYSKYAEDIRKIESELSSFLYPFDEYSTKPSFETKSF